jgi:DNA helicase-2/ATP-dependent DNA helicase PcrA
MLRVPGLYLRSDVIDKLVEEITAAPETFISSMQAVERQMLTTTGGAMKTRSIRLAIENWRLFSSTTETVLAAPFLETMVRKLNLYNFFTKHDAKSESVNEQVRMVQQLILTARAGMYTIKDFVTYLDDLTARYTSIEQHADHVLMTSVHRSKGMQWPHVILPELSEGKFPSVDEQSKASDIESERRLFYVAITRSQQRLTLICPKDPHLQKWSNAFKTGHPPIKSIIASRFIYEANMYGCVLVGKALHGKVINVQPPVNSLISRYRAQI